MRHLILLISIFTVLTANAHNGVVKVPNSRKEIIEGLKRMQITTDALPSDTIDTNIPAVPVDVMGFDANQLTIDGLDSQLERSAEDIIKEGLTPMELIEDTLKEVHRDQDLGPRIPLFEMRALQIIDASKKRGYLNGEFLMRLTLARCVDLAHHVIPTGSNNANGLAVIVGGMYEECFSFAWSLANTNQILKSLAVGGVPTGVAYELQANELPQAIYGQLFASMMIKYSRQLGLSDSAKSFFIMRLVGYLGWDLNSDYMRRTFRPVIVRIANLQKDPVYNEIMVVTGGSAPREPGLGLWNKLNSKWRDIYDLLPEVLLKAYGDYYQRMNMTMKGSRKAEYLR